MKIQYVVIVAVVCLSCPAWAKDVGSKSEFLYEFLHGTYELIGRVPDSNKTYTGKVVLRKSGDYFEVIRRIEGKEIKGTGKIETATADKIKVLRVRFVDGNKSYEATYLIGSDLANYGRLTGYLYLKEGGTKVPGLEALFIGHQALERNFRRGP
jgi:hypothetical protein